MLIQPAGLPRLPVATTAQAVYPLVGKADPVKGKALFFSTKGAGCAKCHRTNLQTQGFGPDLSFLVKQKDPSHIIKSILQPNLEIKEGYATQWILTKSGNVVTGLLKSETAQQVADITAWLLSNVQKKE